MNYGEILTPLATAVVGYLMYLLRSYALSHTVPRQFASVSALAAQAVAAVEQVAKTANLENAAKYTLATKALTASAKRLGVRLNSDEVQAFIHSALHDYKAMNALSTPVPVQ
ncbi:MAG: phage holin, LLH family [Mycobacteriaceae bacterium]